MVTGENLIPVRIEELPDCNFPVHKDNMTKCNYTNWCFSLGVYKCRWIHLCPFKGEREKENLQVIFKQKDRREKNAVL